MKKLMTVCVIAAVVSVAFGADANAKGKKETLTPEQKAERKAQFLARTGGIIQLPGDGTLAVINMQKELPVAALDIVLNQFKRNFKTKVVHIDSDKPFSVGSAEGELKDSSGNAAIFLISDSGLPMSLLAMEGKWAMVNVSQLKTDKPDEAKLKTRFYKEFQRMLYLVLGAGMTENSSVSPLRFVQEAKDLDAVSGAGMEPSMFIGMSAYMPKLGITRGRMAPYRKACREGWAPAPTNDAQRAIWDEFHSLPTKPLVIEPEKKTSAK